MGKTKSIYFLVPYPKGQAPSQRFRFEQYFDVLKENDIKVKVKSFYSIKTWGILHREGNVSLKIFTIILSFWKRFFHVFATFNFDVVFIHREVTPLGPPFFEWFLKSVLRKKIVYDFDDAIWLPNYSEANTDFHKLKNYKKVHSIMKWASIVSCGNDYLKQYASQFNSYVVVNPTTIDTVNYHNPILFNQRKGANSKPVIGWTGTHTTAKYLDFLVPILEKLSEDYEFEMCVISNEKPAVELKNLRFVKWSKETEIEDLLRFDIGVMPLANNKWAKGKCGFKALQYMSLGIPTIASPVGVNLDIIDHKENGFLAESANEWYEALSYFLRDNINRTNMSASAITKVANYYSVKSNTSNFLRLFNL